MLRKFFCVALIGVLVLLAIPAGLHQVNAQDNSTFTDQELADYIAQAYANFANLDSFRYSSNYVIDLSLDDSASDMQITLGVTQDFAGVYVLQNGQITTSSHQAFTETDVSLNGESFGDYIQLDFEWIMIGDVPYIRYDVADPSLNYPEDWTNTEEDRFTPGLSASEIRTMTHQTAGTIPMLAFDLDFLESIELQESVRLNEAKVRVIDIRWDLLTLSEIREPSMMQIFDFSELESAGLDPDQFMENTVIEQRIKIGVHDGLPHQIETLLTVAIEDVTIEDAFGSFDIDMSSSIITNFFDFDADIVIEAPID